LERIHIGAVDYAIPIVYTAFVSANLGADEVIGMAFGDAMPGLAWRASRAAAR